MKTLTESELGQFSGTENWYKHAIARNVTYTDGARHVAVAGEAYWLLDEIALAQSEHGLKRNDFQVWNLRRDGEGCTLIVDDGNDAVIYTKRIAFTDFPLPEIKLYVCEGGPGNTRTIMLPGEY
jgi:hypothetical protein